MSLLSEEQWILLRRLWHRYGRYLTLLLLAAVILFGVWHFSYQRSVKRSKNAAQVYHQALQAQANHDQSKVQSLCKTIVDQYQTTVYADLAQLMLAKYEVQNRQYNEALEHLKHAANRTRVPYLKQLAYIRMARINNQQGYYRKAIDHLKRVNLKALKPWAALTQSEAYYALGKHQHAARLYQWASGRVNENSVLLQMVNPAIKQLAADQSQ